MPGLYYYVKGGDEVMMCTVKDLKLFLGLSKGLTVGETRSLMYKMIDNLDDYYDDSQKLLMRDNGNDYKPKALWIMKTKR